MIIWASKNYAEQIFSLDPPDDEENWIMLATKEHHFKEIAKLLDTQVKIFTKQEDYRSAKIAKDLAAELRRSVYKDTTVN